MRESGKKSLITLPAWAAFNSCTAAFFEWLTSEVENSTWEQKHYTVVKVKQGSFFYLYLQQRAGKSLLTGENLKFAGLFARRNGYLYDMNPGLLRLLDLPEEMYFPKREDIIREAEVRISRKAGQLIKTHWQEFLCGCGYEPESLIPIVIRSEIRERAETCYLKGENLADIQFFPDISLGNLCSDTSYLLFLEYGERAAEKMAKRWIRQNIPYISKQKILYGCVREEFQNILDSPKDVIHQVRALRQALEGNEQNMVQVVICRKQKAVQIRMQAEELANPKGRYHIQKYLPKDRIALEKVLGKGRNFRIEEIQRVTYSGELLYESPVKKNAA